ncbi:MAG: carbohydrate kinase [Treponema sp.]|nr:carbohydrate kinase [Treponema sp.]
MIVCCGETVIDMVQTPVSGLGEVFFSLPGGCSYNTSIAIGRLGAPVAFLGRISTNFFGEIQLKRLRENHVKDDLIIRCDKNPVLAIIKVEEGKEPAYAFYDEGTGDRSLSTDDMPAQVPADTTCIVFGSISMTMEPVATTIETFILREAARRVPVIAFDPNIRPFMIRDRDAYMKRFEKWIGASTIAKISFEDFEFIYPNPEPEQALRKILALGSRLAIITLGPQGAMAMLQRDDGNVIKASAPAIHIPELVDTVGAGDTFHGAFLSWLELRGKMSLDALADLSETDLRNALVYANKAAGIVCTRHGAEPPTPEEVERMGTP